MQTGSQIDWESVHHFLEVARGGSFRSAAEKLEKSLNTVRRRVHDLEQNVGFLLFTRHVDGVRLTREGRHFLSAAEKMEQASYDALRQTNTEPLSGIVRLSVTEGLGTLWVMPRVVEFQRANPNLIMEMNCAMQEADLLRMEADIGIQLQKPANPDLICTRLGSLHIIPFASREYVETYGKPGTLEEAAHFNLVEQRSPQIDLSALDKLFPDTPKEGFISVRTNTSSAHFFATISGAGLGMLPTYVHALGAPLVPIDVGVHMQYDIWMSYHPDLAKNKRVRKTMDWIKDAFEAQSNPWFQKEFVHPCDFDQRLKMQSMRPLPEGLFGKR